MRSLTFCLLCLLFPACSDDMKTDESTATHGDDDTTGDDDDTSTSGDEDDTGPTGDDDDDDTPTGDDDDDDTDTGRTTHGGPDLFEGRDCPNGMQATWLSGELVVFSDQPAVTGELDVPVGGLYHVYDTSVAESGAGQTNESAFVRVPNVVDPVGHPSPLGLTNCGLDYIAVDNDNVSPPPANALQYLGTFFFEDGVNTVEFHHYCELWFQGQCLPFHDGGTPCDAGINSVHFLGDAVCLVTAP